MLVNGWQDTGYHYVIGNGTDSGNGQVEMGRPTDQRGAHCKNNNHDSIGICLVGNFLNKYPFAKQYDALIQLLAVECNRHGLNPTGFYRDGDSGVISGHKDWRATECPGKIESLLERIRIDVKARIERHLLLKSDRR